MTTPSPQVVTAFHAAAGTPEPLGSAWDYGWRYDSIVVARALGPRVAWSSRVREKLHVPGLQIARPVRAADGRFLAAGWRATGFVPGRPEARVDEVAAAALRLDAALAEISEAPDPTGEDYFSTADRAAWVLDPDGAAALDRTLANEVMADLITPLRAALAREPAITTALQPVHLDMLATTLFHGTRAPAVTDLVGTMRPGGYTAALTIVDGLLAEAVDSGVLYRFDHVPDLRALLLRGLLYRVYIHALTPTPHSSMFAKLSRVIGLLSS